MGITANPTLIGLTPSSLPTGFTALRGNWGGNSLRSGLVDTSGAVSNSVMFNGISTQTNFSIYIEQIINFIDGSGKPTMALPVFRCNSGGTSAYVFTATGADTYQLFSGNMSAATFSGLGTGRVAFFPQIGDTCCVYLICKGNGIYMYVWNKKYGQPSGPQISLSDSTISSAGYAGIFSANNTGLASSCPTITVFKVGTGMTSPELSFTNRSNSAVTMLVNGPVGDSPPFTAQILTSPTPGAPQSQQTIYPGVSASFVSSSMTAGVNVVLPLTNNGITYARPLYTDSGSTPETFLQNELPIMSNNAKAFVFVGDSLTFGVSATSGSDPVSQIQNALVGLCAPNSVSVINQGNQGQPGASTTDWLPGNSTGYFSGAVTASNSAGATDLHIMLGTNDARIVNPPSVVLSNMQTIINTFFSQIPTLGRIWLSNPPYIGENAAANLYSNESNAFLIQYANVINSLVDGVKVFKAADTYAAFAALYLLVKSSYYSGDNVHLTNQGYLILALMWANTMASILQPSGQLNLLNLRNLINVMNLELRRS